MKYSFLRYFFVENAAPEDVGVQRCVPWIGVAIVLQSCNEIGHDWFVQSGGVVGPLIPFVLYTLSLLALVPVFCTLPLALFTSARQSRPSALKKPHSPASTFGHPYAIAPDLNLARRSRPAVFGRALILLLLVIFSFRGLYEFGRGVAQSLQRPPQYWNDGASLSMNAAILLVEGKNPYTDSRFGDLVRRFQVQPNWTTPLRQGEFADRLDYPTQSEIEQAFQSALQTGQAPEFETKVSYPALSFLPFVPYALFGQFNSFSFYLLSYLLLLGSAWYCVRPALRGWALLLGLTNIPLWGAAVGGNLDVLCFLLLILAWLGVAKRGWSVLWLGLAISTKQVAWFFLPFYLLWIWRRCGFKEAVYRALLAGGVALLINAPFIVWNPQAWLTGILVPMFDPMFPAGVGLINLSTLHILPFFPTWLYTALEVLALGVALLWYWRICRDRPEAVMWLAVVPLFFAWRSLPSYFACAAFGLFVLMGAGVQSRIHS